MPVTVYIALKIYFFIITIKEMVYYRTVKNGRMTRRTLENLKSYFKCQGTQLLLYVSVFAIKSFSNSHRDADDLIFRRWIRNFWHTNNEHY